MEYKRKSLLLFVVVFGISGFSGLIYESIWSHYLKLFLGHSAYAQALVLSIFMGGMAIGAALISRITIKIKRPIYNYAIVEGLVGIIALLFHFIFLYVTDYINYSVVPGIDSVFMTDAVKISSASLLILPQAILLGTTFPLMSAGIIRIFPEQRGKILALLYFINSLGAAIGVLVSSFVLIEISGLPGTISIAGVVNILLSIVVLIFLKEQDEVKITEIRAKSLNSDSGNLGLTLLAVAALTGAASFLYEIGWIRMLCLVGGSATHSFEIMLSAFILGLAIGGFVIRKRIDGMKNPKLSLGKIQIAMGLCALLTLFFYSGSFGFMKFTEETLSRTDTGYLLFNLYSYGLSMLIMLPATIFAGMTLPLITFILLKGSIGEKSIGRVYSVNTIGSIVGVIVGYLFIMPVMGLKFVIISGGAIDIILGIVLLLSSGNRKLVLIIFAPLAVFLGFLSFAYELNTLEMATCMFKTKDANVKKEVVFHKDGRTSSVDVIKFETAEAKGIGISANGNPLGNMSLTPNKIFHENNAILLAALPMAMRENPEKAATFGMGTGMTSHILLSNPNIRKLDIVEIEESIIEGALEFGERVENTLNDKRCNVHIEDAKTFFYRSPGTYDLIIADPTSPWVSGVSGLYSQEFYELMSKKTGENGLFVQWLLSSGLNTEIIISVLKAASQSFSDYEIYNVNDAFMILIAANNKIGMPDYNIFVSDELKKQLGRLGIEKNEDFYLFRLCGRQTLDLLMKSYPNIPANSDFYPFLDFEAQKSVFKKSDANELLTLKTIAAPLVEIIENRNSKLIDHSMAPYDFTKFTALAKKAKKIINYFKAKRDSLFYLVEDEELAGLIARIEKINSGCAEINSKSLNWLQALKDIMLYLIPYSSVEESEIFWDAIESSPCYYLLDDEAKRWALMFKAVCMRNYGRARALSLHLLPADGKIEANSANDYLLLINLLSNAALNEKSAPKIWDRYENKNNPSIHLRMAIEHFNSM